MSSKSIKECPICLEEHAILTVCCDLAMAEEGVDDPKHESICAGCLMKHARASIDTDEGTNLAPGGLGLRCPMYNCDGVLQFSTYRAIIKTSNAALWENIIKVIEAINLTTLHCCHCEYPFVHESHSTGSSTLKQQRSISCLECGHIQCSVCEILYGQRPCRAVTTSNAMSTISEFNNIAEQLTEAMTRVCKNCSSKLFRVEGCNKLKCRCNVVLCYRCGASGINDKHFCSGAQSDTNGRKIIAPSAKQGACALTPMMIPKRHIFENWSFRDVNLESMSSLMAQRAMDVWQGNAADAHRTATRQVLHPTLNEQTLYRSKGKKMASVRPSRRNDGNESEELKRARREQGKPGKNVDCQQRDHQIIPHSNPIGDNGDDEMEDKEKENGPLSKKAKDAPAQLDNTKNSSLPQIFHELLEEICERMTNLRVISMENAETSQRIQKESSSKPKFEPFLVKIENGSLYETSEAGLRWLMENEEQEEFLIISEDQQRQQKEANDNGDGDLSELKFVSLDSSEAALRTTIDGLNSNGHFGEALPLPSSLLLDEAVSNQKKQTTTFRELYLLQAKCFEQAPSEEIMRVEEEAEKSGELNIEPKEMAKKKNSGANEKEKSQQTTTLRGLYLLQAQVLSSSSLLLSKPLKNQNAIVSSSQLSAKTISYMTAQTSLDQQLLQSKNLLMEIEVLVTQNQIQNKDPLSSPLQNPTSPEEAETTAKETTSNNEVISNANGKSSQVEMPMTPTRKLIDNLLESPNEEAEGRVTVGILKEAPVLLPQLPPFLQSADSSIETGFSDFRGPPNVPVWGPRTPSFSSKNKKKTKKNMTKPSRYCNGDINNDAKIPSEKCTVQNPGEILNNDVTIVASTNLKKIMTPIKSSSSSNKIEKNRLKGGKNEKEREEAYNNNHGFPETFCSSNSKSFSSAVVMEIEQDSDSPAVEHSSVTSNIDKKDESDNGVQPLSHLLVLESTKTKKNSLEEKKDAYKPNYVKNSGKENDDEDVVAEHLPPPLSVVLPSKYCTRSATKAMDKRDDAQYENYSFRNDAGEQQKKNRNKVKTTMRNINGEKKSIKQQIKSTSAVTKSEQKNETTAQEKRKFAPCSVCGDMLQYNCANKSARMPVCQTCQVFFYQSVREGDQHHSHFRCNCGGTLAKMMDVQSRNRCRSCRFLRCIKAKMRPSFAAKLGEKKRGRTSPASSTASMSKKGDKKNMKKRRILRLRLQLRSRSSTTPKKSPRREGVNFRATKGRIKN